jgi:DNA-binding PadR family transcriptional regulator
LTPATFHILVTLLDGARHGYAVKREVEERTSGVIRLGAGTLYTAIRRLEESRFIAVTDPPPEVEAAARSRWKFYRLTERGRGVLEAEAARLEADVEDVRRRLAATSGPR